MSTVNMDPAQRALALRMSPRLETLQRKIRRKEEQLLILVPSTTAARLVLENHGVREHLSENVLRADRRAATVLDERLRAIVDSRGQPTTVNNQRRYYNELVQTIRLFHLYREFQLWQAARLPNANNTNNSDNNNQEGTQNSEH